MSELMTSRNVAIKNQIDLFIAAPMSGFDDELAYQAHREQAVQLTKCLRAIDGVASVYYAGESIGSSDEFSGSCCAFLTDMAALSKSQIVVLLYPKKVVTSALVEVGVALGQGKRILIFAESKGSLPYILQEADRCEGSFGGISVVEATALESLVSEAQRFIVGQFH